jgi:hypothetical protein
VAIPRGRWRSTDAYGSSTNIEGGVLVQGRAPRPRPAAGDRHIHVHLPAGWGPTHDAAPRRRTRDPEDPDPAQRSWGSPSGGLPMATRTQNTEPGSAGFEDQDPIGARRQPGDQFTVGEDCDEGGFSLRRNRTGDAAPYGVEEPSLMTKKLGDQALRRLDRQGGMPRPPRLSIARPTAGPSAADSSNAPEKRTEYGRAR